jgi:hypothetical protein
VLHFLRGDSGFHSVPHAECVPSSVPAPTAIANFANLRVFSIGLVSCHT